jgi:hypothetical protein
MHCNVTGDRYLDHFVPRRAFLRGDEMVFCGATKWTVIREIACHVVAAYGTYILFFFVQDTPPLFERYI